MKVGIIGSGGREHAICNSLNKSKYINKIYCFPGNAGTSDIAENVNINIASKKFCCSKYVIKGEENIVRYYFYASRIISRLLQLFIYFNF